jgi:hypothetical protein
MWNVVEACSRGTSHTATGKPCQDAVLVHRFESLGGPAVAIAIADGAGSAERSDLGAQEVVAFLVKSAAAFSGNFGQIKKEDVLLWFDDARRHLAEQVASAANCPVDALASTAMLAILWETGAAFAHVGDGAWVAQKGEAYVVVTWPFSGEYANQTKFLTSADAGEHFVFDLFAERPAAVAGFTDGVQLLALNFASESAHAPFYDRLLAPLRGGVAPGELKTALATFLDSSLVNERTDDDKTLVLACWCEPNPVTHDTTG